MFTIPHTNTTNFSNNFNGKLILQNFPTVRLANTTKYYVGAKHLIKLNNNQLGIAEITAIRTFQFSQINDNLSLVDGSMNAAKFKAMLVRMYSNKQHLNDATQLMHIIYSWAERDIQQTTDLMNNWHQRTIADTKQNAQLQSQLNFYEC